MKVEFLANKSVYVVTAIIGIILVLIAGAYWYEVSAPPVAIAAICKDNYPDTDEGWAAFNQDTDNWVKQYLETNPFTTLEEVDSARQKSWEEIGCSTATNDSEVRCPTQETFVKDFTEFSIALLDANPGYAEKEQRYYWQKHLEEMGCIESQSIIDNAICADCNEDGSWSGDRNN